MSCYLIYVHLVKPYFEIEEISPIILFAQVYPSAIEFCYGNFFAFRHSSKYNRNYKRHNLVKPKPYTKRSRCRDKKIGMSIEVTWEQN